MKLYAAMPDRETLARDVLNTTLRHVGGLLPSVIAGRCEVVLNAHGMIPHVDGAAVYLVPAFDRPHRTPHPARLVLVTGTRRVVHGRATVEWCEGVVGEIDEQAPTTP